MNDRSTTDINYWSAVDAGFRGSQFLRLGAAATAVGALVNLGARLLGGADGPAQDATTVAWLLFILGLWLLAAGFFLVGSHSFLTRFGIVVGLFHAAQGVQLLVLLFTFTSALIPPISLTVGRLLVTLLFAVVEREWLPRRTSRLLGTAAALLLLKASLRALGYLPDLGPVLDPLLDAVLLLYLAATFFQLAGAVRTEENEWARVIYGSGQADFADFNNPEHEWNKREAQRRNKS